MSFKTSYQQIKVLISDEKWEAAKASIMACSKDYPEYSQLNKLTRLLGSLPRTQLPHFRLALLGNWTMAQLAPLLELHAYLSGIYLETYLGQYDQYWFELNQPAPRLQEFKPDGILLSVHHDAIDLPGPFAEEEQLERHWSNGLEKWAGLWDKGKSNFGAHMIQANIAIPPDWAFGHAAAQYPWAPKTYLQEFNARLGQLTRSAGVSLFDIDAISSNIGKCAWFDNPLWFFSKQLVPLEYLSYLGQQLNNVITSLVLGPKKVLILDLDNTLWKGIVGDDGVEGIEIGNGTAAGESFALFQRYALTLKERGVILAVCSKNELSAARLPFESHPGMSLKPDDIACFVANWNPKSENIRHIAKELNIGLDACVYIDDNPAERMQVRDALPMVAVPEIPDDISQVPQFLAELGYFEAISITSEDALRSSYYQSNRRREELQSTQESIGDYLAALEMKATITPVSEGTLARAHQLLSKTNQFNLTTIRYTQKQIQSMIASPLHEVAIAELSDRFGSNGWISVIILEKINDILYIDSWVLSCRVFSRGFEDCAFDWIYLWAKENQCEEIKGRYISTAKNMLVDHLYEHWGFEQENGEQGLWRLPLNRYKPVKHYIGVTYDGKYRNLVGTH